MKKTIVFLLALCSLSLVFAQEKFEGTLIFSASYTGDKELVNKVGRSLPDTMEWQFQEGKSFFEMSGGMSAMLMNRMYAEPRDGEVYLIATAQNMNYKFTETSRKEAWANKKDAKAIVERGEEDQKLGGFDCEHYLIIQDTRRGRDTMDMWVATDLKVDFPNTQDLTGSGLFSISQFGLEGFPMKIVHPMPIPGKTIYTNLEIAFVKKDETEKNKLSLPAAYQLKDYHMVPPKK